MAMIKTCSTPPIAVPKVSGPVCSFKALQALPLKNCEVAINAWQEGSGDPSPENERPIHGWDEVNISQSGVNIWDEEWEEGGYDNITGEKVSSNILYRNVDFISVKPNTSYYFTVVNGNRRVWYYDINKTFISSRNSSTAFEFTTPPNCYYINFALSRSAWNDVSINYPSTDTNYHAYTGTTATIDLDGTRYGGYVNVLTGEMTATYKTVMFDGSETVRVANSNYIKRDACDGFINVDDMYGGYGPPVQVPFVICDKLKYASASIWSSPGYPNTWAINSIQIHFNIANSLLGITDYTQETVSTVTPKLKEWLSINKPTFVYPLAESFTVQLTPVQIDTILNTNNIFADTGDTAVRYIKIGG